MFKMLLLEINVYIYDTLVSHHTSKYQINLLKKTMTIPGTSACLFIIMMFETDKKNSLPFSLVAWIRLKFNLKLNHLINCEIKLK
jgi:hypothetical protein